MGGGIGETTSQRRQLEKGLSLMALRECNDLEICCSVIIKLCPFFRLAFLAGRLSYQPPRPPPPDSHHQTSAIPSDLAIFSTGALGLSAPRPPPQTRHTNFPQHHRTLPYFPLAFLASRLSDHPFPPGPAPPNFRNAIGFCNFPPPVAPHSTSTGRLSSWPRGTAASRGE